eukprot:jgi/Mesen1/4549/ME000232S03799
MAPFDLASKISKVEVDHRFPLKNYYRSAQNVLKQAEIYRAEKNILELYVLLFKFASLIAETVPAHLEFKRGGFETEQKHYKKLLPTIFDEIERLKPQVNSLVNEINRGQVSLQQQQRQQQQQQQDGAWPIYPPSSSYSSLDAATTTDYFFFDGMVRNSLPFPVGLRQLPGCEIFPFKGLQKRSGVFFWCDCPFV